MGTAGSMLLTTLFAYPLSRRDLPLRKGISFFVFFTMLFNGGLFQLYDVDTDFSYKDTLAALIIPALLECFLYYYDAYIFCDKYPMEWLNPYRLTAAVNGKSCCI